MKLPRARPCWNWCIEKVELKGWPALPRLGFNKIFAAHYLECPVCGVIFFPRIFRPPTPATLIRKWNRAVRQTLAKGIYR